MYPLRGGERGREGVKTVIMTGEVAYVVLFLLSLFSVADIAGEEAGYPAAEYRDAFQLASKNFLFKTCHAGEAWGPEAIYQAITDLHTERIGHGYHIFSVSQCKKGKEGRE